MCACPAILGVYQSEASQKAGRGQATIQEFVQRLSWLVLRLDEERCLALALNDQHLPGEVGQSLSHESLLSGYSPEPGIFRERLLPVLIRLRDKLEILGGDKAADLLSPEEAQVFRALSIGRKLAAQADEVQVVRMLLAALPVAGEFAAVAAAELNAEAVLLRKAGRGDRAAAWLEKALELTPDDDHLLFNLARAYYENGDAPACRRCLERALALNPGLAAATRFLEFLGGGEDRARRRNLEEGR